MDLKNALIVLVLIISMMGAKGQNYYKDFISQDPV